VSLRPPLTLRTGRRSLLVLLATALVFAGCSSDKPTLEAATTTVSVDPESTSCDPSLDGFPNHVAFAKQQGAIGIYPEPGAAVPKLTLVDPRQTDTEPPIDVPLAFLAINEPEDNCEWIEVLLPVRPNGSTGWVKRADVRMEGNPFTIKIDLANFNLKAYKGDDVILDAPIGVARENTPTPGGLYYTTELLQPPNPDTVYGTHAFGLSGYSEVLTSFNGGQGQLGVHGTNEPEKIGQSVSAGCVRLRNEDIDKLVAAIDDPYDTYGIRVEIAA
jgi:lipoprotein-anchoring transpeptidase ErfK/SrfK